MLEGGLRSTPAHARKRHPLDQAHSPTAAQAGTLVYVVCGWQGCAQRLEVDAAVWQAELARRSRGGASALPEAFYTALESCADDGSGGEASDA